MKRTRFQWLLGLAFVALWFAVWLWQHPGARGERISAEDMARYERALSTAVIPKDVRDQLLARVRAWSASDDGRAVYMLNVLRFNPELRRFEGGPTDGGDPHESNARYEAAAGPLLLKHGGYPVYAGEVQGPNLLEHRALLDRWDRTLVVRYPSRRAFMEVIVDPEFLKVVPYKLMALSVMLVPTKVELLIPELSTLLGAVLLVVYLAIGWWRASRRR
jgi:hypothetical protein